MIIWSPQHCWCKVAIWHKLGAHCHLFVVIFYSKWLNGSWKKIIFRSQLGRLGIHVSIFGAFYCRLILNSPVISWVQYCHCFCFIFHKRLKSGRLNLQKCIGRHFECLYYIYLYKKVEPPSGSDTKNLTIKNSLNNKRAPMKLLDSRY